MACWRPILRLASSVAVEEGAEGSRSWGGFVEASSLSRLGCSEVELVMLRKGKQGGKKGGDDEAADYFILVDIGKLHNTRSTVEC